MSILTIIAQRLPALSAADRAIGQYILDRADAVPGLSSAALAAATGRSQSAVVKFSQKLGYAGYQELKLAVNRAKAQEWQVPPGVIHGSIDADDSFLTLVHKLVGSKMLSVQQTMAANRETTVTAVLDLLTAARRIHLAGLGASWLVARDFSFKLMKLGRVVMLDADSHVQLANAAMLEPEDVLVALSYSGMTLETRRVAEMARTRGARLVAITGPQPNPLAELADLRLLTIAEDQVRSSAITSRDAQLALIDLLFILMAQRMPEANDLIHRSEAAVAVSKPGPA
jgi:DNA-binding MurR/RpiR family transcriptional regulator